MEATQAIPTFVQTQTNNVAKNTTTVINRGKQILNRGRQMITEGSSDAVSFFKYMILLVLFGLLIFLGYVYYTYLQAECVKKKDFLTYLFQMDWNRPCSISEETILVPAIETEKKPAPVPVNQSLAMDSLTYKVDEILDRNEVFHISDQVYTFEEAKCKCNSYGATLATEEQLNEAYNKGAHWCSYGWSAGQKALYPIQQCIWKEEGVKCGKPGINGGYFPNGNLRFGINCYGKKPKGTVLKPKDTCDSDQDANQCAKPKVQKQGGDSIAPFKPTQWSQATGTL
jgi:Extracellular link domain